MIKPLCYGRLGNFLFQVATAIGYATKHNIQFTVPNTTHDAKWAPIYLQHLVNPGWDASLPEVKIVEKGHEFQHIPFKEEWRGKNILLDGYWQTEKYFSHCRQRIIDEFGLGWCLNKGTVSVHIRRGDYLALRNKHPFITEEWVREQMVKFPGFRFVFFSDDIEWCKKTYADVDGVMFSEGRNEIEDIKEMSCCEHHICSASTFSWWASWLNQNPSKRIIMPKLWFMPGHGRLNVKDIVPASWERA